MKRLLVGLSAASLMLGGLAVAVSAKPVTLTGGNLVLRLDGKITPKALSRTKPTPITFRLSADVRAKDGGHPPAARIFDAEIDRNGALDPEGLPVCRRRQLVAQTTAGAKRSCRAALVGQGFAAAEIEFPEQPAFEARGPLLIFNGGAKGRETVLLAHVYANVPAPTAFVTPVKVTEINRGKYGLRVYAKIPVIAGGSGSMTMLQLTNRKIFTHKGKKRSYFLARCTTGHLFGRGKLSFSDGTRLLGTLSLPCTPKR